VPASPPPPPPPALRPTSADVGAIVDSIDDDQDVFWQLIPHILATEFPPEKLTRVGALIEFSQGRRPVDPIDQADSLRPYQDLHAYMPGIPASPWRDPSDFAFARELEENFPVIKAEFEALLGADGADFQHVTEMNYESGWKTLVLCYNSQKRPGFPYHLCPVTTRILDTVPIAGRIAGFNRQLPNSGIPLHTDGNNMWLTLQMGISLPKGEERPWIRVGPESRSWEEGKCLVYDTTYEHETFNPSPSEERVVLHVDFWNYHDMTPVELAAMQRVYELRERFLEAEGVANVAAKRLG